MEAMLEQRTGLEEAKSAFFVADKDGLLGKDSLNLSHEQAVFAREKDRGLPLIEIVKKYKPTIPLGLTAFGGLLNERLITTMIKGCERPIIFALSNPTTIAECTAKQAYKCTDGKCIFASGSPFDLVEYKGQTFHPSQCNNINIFPGLELEATMCGALRLFNILFPPWHEHDAPLCLRTFKGTGESQSRFTRCIKQLSVH